MSSWSEPARTSVGDFGDSLRGWALGPGGPVLCGRGSAPPACSTDCALGRHADCREGLGPGFSGPRIKVPGWVRPPSFPRFGIHSLKRAQESRALRGTRRRWDLICPRLGRSHRALRLAHKAPAAPRWLFPAEVKKPREGGSGSGCVTVACAHAPSAWLPLLGRYSALSSFLHVKGCANSQWWPRAQRLCSFRALHDGGHPVRGYFRCERH